MTSQSNQMIRVLIVDDIPEMRDGLKRLLTLEMDIEVIGTASDGDEAVKLTKALHPDIVLMDIHMPKLDGMSATEQINKESPNTEIILMSAGDETRNMRRAMLVGARYFLSKPISGDELCATLRDVYQRRKPGVTTSDPDAPPLVPEGHIIVVYAPQAGAGATTVATNLAASLMREGTDVLLVDANLYFGDVGVFLNAQPQNTLVDLVGRADDLDRELVDSILTTHESGLRILPAPHTPEEAEGVQPEQLIALIKKLRAIFNFIVIDTATHLDALNAALFDLANQILLIVNPTLPSVKNTHNILNLMTAWDYNASKVRLVVNRVNTELEKSRLTLSVEAIENSLKREAIGVIPMDERHILAAINRGVTVVAKDRMVSPAKELNVLADIVYTSFTGARSSSQKEQRETSKSRLGRLRH